MKQIKDRLIYNSIGTFEAVEEENSRTIRGTAVVFDVLSRMKRDERGNAYYEKINRDAITEDFLASQDVTMNVDHDDSRLLARYNKGMGTLRLSVDEYGVHFEFEAPETALGDEVLYNVRNHNLFECSFACLVNPKFINKYSQDGVQVQEITKLTAMLDCAIVVRAAYAETDVIANSAETDEPETEETEETKEETVENEQPVVEETKVEDDNKEQILNALNEKITDFYKNITI